MKFAKDLARQVWGLGWRGLTLSHLISVPHLFAHPPPKFTGIFHGGVEFYL